MDSLIQPLKKGRPLLDEIAATTPAPGSLAVWWLGQSGYVIKSQRGTLVVDPYLSEHLTTKYANTAKPHVRMTESPVRGTELQGVDLVLSSHIHSDHMDPGTLPALMKASPQAFLLVPCSILEHAQSLGIDPEQTYAMEAGDCHAEAGFFVRAIPSAHERLDTDAKGRHLYLGWVIEAEGRRVYHSGDTVRYDGLEGWLGPGPFDALFLPINGRDPRRGVAGNMSAVEAVALASSVRPRFVVPHHYDMFTFNTVQVSDFIAQAKFLPDGVRPQVLRVGERWILSPS